MMLPASIASLGAANNGAWMNRELYTIQSAGSVAESSGDSSSEEEGGQSRSNGYARRGSIVKKASTGETSMEIPGLLGERSDDESEGREPQYEDYESIVKNPSSGELSADLPILRNPQRSDESEDEHETISLSDEDLLGRRTSEDDNDTISLSDEEYLVMRRPEKSSLTPYLTLNRVKSRSTDSTSQSQDEFHGEGWSTGTDDTSTPDHQDFYVVKKMLSERNLRDNHSNSAHSHDYVLQCVSDESGSPPASPQPYMNPRPEQRPRKLIGSMSKAGDEEITIYTSDASTAYYSEDLADSSSASLSDAAHNTRRERRHLYDDDSQSYLLNVTKGYPLTLDNVETFSDVDQSSRTSGLSSMDGPLSQAVTNGAFFSSALVPKVIPLKGQDEVSNFNGSNSLQDAPMKDHLAVVPFANPSHYMGNVKDIETGDASHVTEITHASRLSHLIFGCFDERSSTEIFFLWLIMTSTTILILLVVVVLVGAL